MEQKNQLMLEVEKSRKNLLTMILLTAVNLVLIAVEATISFPFSASLPQIFLIFGQAFTNEYGEAFYAVIGIALAVIHLGLYGLFYFLSKKRGSFLMTAFLFFVIDTLIMFLLFLDGFDISAGIDMLFHLWVLVTLFAGVRAARKLKKLQSDAASLEEAEQHDFEMK